MNYVRCTSCGKRVSNIIDQDIYVRAYIECPECIDKLPEQVSNVGVADTKDVLCDSLPNPEEIRQVATDEAEGMDWNSLTNKYSYIDGFINGAM